MAKIYCGTITKAEAREESLKAAKAERRLTTLHHKHKVHHDKRTKRNRTRREQKRAALKDQG